MKKLISIIIGCCLLLLGCASQPKESFDGRARPSINGRLQVVDGKLADKTGLPVMLRGLSNSGVSMSALHTRQDTYDYISKDMGANVMRLALYTYGVGEMGYVTGSNSSRAQMDQLVEDGINFAKNADMYIILDWHILDDGDPNRFIQEAKEYFDKISQQYKGMDHIIYEICNEPNGKDVDWKCIKTYAQQIIPIIRNNDPNALIIVGTPNWSRDVDEAAKDPLEFENIMYTLHFYAASHKQELRDKFLEANRKGLPIFVTEFGITSSSGGFPIDEEEANRWINLLEENGISYVMWNFSKTGEACSVLRKSTLKFTDFTEEDFNQAGLWFIETLKNHK